jgi:hypothetical protein
MDKICLIYQPAGIGDIFYTIGVAKHYKKLGYRIIWPVVKEILYLNEYIDGIEFYDWKGDFPKKEYYDADSLNIINTEDFIFLPIHKSTDIIGGLVMPSKYQLANVSYDTWKENFVWKRNTKKEDELYYDVLKLTDNEQYVLVNQNFVTPPRTMVFPINIDTNHKMVSMSYIDGYNVLDWAKVIERANGIVTIDTCIQYMIEKLENKSEFFYCYLRNGINTYYQIKDLFSTPWIFLDENNNIIK